MASRKENLKALFTNTRSRMIIIIVAITLVSALTIGIVSFKKQTVVIGGGGILQGNLGGISSTPGALNQSPAYAKLQNEQNIKKASQALEQGKSAIPTIIDLKALGDGVKTVGPQGGTGSLGFETLANLQTGSQKPLWLQNLLNSQCDQKTYQEAIKNNAALSDLKLACSCQKLKSYGYDSSQLVKVCPCQDLREAGTTALELKNLGFDAEQLKMCGFSACDLKSAGFSATDLKNAGFSDAELAGSGFLPSEIDSGSGLPSGVTSTDVKNAGCGVEALRKLRDQGVTAAAIRRISGCDASALKAAGFSAKDLKNAGFTAAELKAAGFSANDLLQRGYSPKELLDTGFSSDELEGAGVNPDVIRAAQLSLPPGITPAALKELGCCPQSLAKTRIAGVSVIAITKINGCSAAELKAGGYSDNELKAAGMTSQVNQSRQMTPDDVKQKGCSVAAIKQEISQGVSAAAIVKYAGCSKDDLIAAGLNLDAVKESLAKAASGCEIQAIINAGCDPLKLSKLGVSAAKIAAVNHCPASVLKSAGFKVQDLLSSGFSQSELLKVGFANQDINLAFEQNAETKNVSDSEIMAADCQPLMLGNLRRAGISAARIKASNRCQISAFKNACFSPGSMISAGFTPDELQRVGFSQSEIQQAQNVLQTSANLSDQMIKDAGCEVNKLKNLRDLGLVLAKIQNLNHCDVKTVTDAGYCLSDVLAAGFSPTDIASLSVSSSDIQQAQNNLAGLVSNQCPPQSLIPLPNISSVTNETAPTSPACDPKKLETLNNPLLALADARTSQCSLVAAKKAFKAGISAEVLRKTLGCSAATLSQAGFSPQDLKAAGFSAGELAKLGLPLASLINAGYHPQDLKDSGFSAKDLLAQGIKPSALAAAGFSPQNLLDAGLGPKELLAGGVSPDQLKKLGYSAEDLKKAGLSPAQLSLAGYSTDALKDAGFSDAQVTSPAATVGASETPLDPSSAKVVALQQQLLSNIAKAPTSNVQKTAEQGIQSLNKAVEEQKKLQTAMKFQQKIQQKTSMLQSYATQLLSGWRQVASQSYVAGTPKTDKLAALGVNAAQVSVMNAGGAANSVSSQEPDVFIKSGDILFAVIDTAVNTDEPSPILATITNGPLRGAKLIGSFNLPGNADKTIITFTTLSIQGIDKTTGISAYAIDPNTGRTALSSSTNHHYLMRYGSLFASTFIQGFGNAFQSADTTITIGGTGGTGGPNTTTVQNGIGRSLTSNAVIGLATLGQSWAQQAQQNMAVPTTVQVFSGTPIGVLFLQDVSIQTTQTK